jgi:hypothetical protein
VAWLFSIIGERKNFFYGNSYAFESLEAAKKHWGISFHRLNAHKV